MEKKIGILGSGIVGKTLAAGFAKHGYEVMIGSDTPAKREELTREMPAPVQVGSLTETAAFGEILVLAVKGFSAVATLQKAGLANLKGKTILDTTNPILETGPVNGVLQYFTAQNESLMERFQAAAPEANFVKCFSCVGAYLMVDPQIGGTKPTMFICGNNDTAKETTKSILDEFGWEYEDCGTVEAARAIEPLAMLWCIPGFRENRWMHAFKLLK
ncbi:MAG: NAD(P)-binding domain-containing protein [bacterium]|nr:NAD(P)-binding domain-containing protein [bacterium]